MDFDRFAADVRRLCPDVGMIVHNANGIIDVWHRAQDHPIKVLPSTFIIDGGPAVRGVMTAIRDAIEAQEEQDDAAPVATTDGEQR